MQHECALHDANKHITTIEQKNFGKKKVEFLFQKFFFKKIVMSFQFICCNVKA
jgi:hypothetical protein